MRRTRRVYYLVMALLLTLFGVAFVAAECVTCVPTPSGGIQCGGGGGGGGGSGGPPGGGGNPTATNTPQPPAPTATPWPYSWIEDLPLAGQTDTHQTVWCKLNQASGLCIPFPMYWHGNAYWNFSLVDASTYTMQVSKASMGWWVYNAAPWVWSWTVISQTLYDSHTAVSTYTIDPSCPTITQPPPNMLGGLWCRNIQPVAYVGGANGELDILLATPDLLAVRLYGGDLSFRHKLYP